MLHGVISCAKFVLFEMRHGQDTLASVRWSLPESHLPIADVHLKVDIIDCAIRFEPLHRLDREHKISELSSIDPPQEIKS